jgi:virulence-associated protein VapD
MSVNSTYSDIRLAKVLNDNIEGSLYVDDFLICYRGENVNTIERQLQLCLNKIEK